MTDFNNSFEANEDSCLTSSEKWVHVCRISNILLSILYIPGGWYFGFLGIMLFSLGISDIFSFLMSLLILFTPVFCVLGIVFSVHLRKKKAFAASFKIQFIPFVALGAALFFYILSMITL